jgi:predicted GIY-YIG superfamily endonuclease
MASRSPTKKKSSASEPPTRDHHHVYVVFLRNPKGDGKAAYYVGMTGLSPEQRFENHKAGVKAARVVRKFGVRLVPRLYRHLNPMPYAKAKDMEAMLADSLRKRGFVLYGLILLLGMCV